MHVRRRLRVRRVPRRRRRLGGDLHVAPRRGRRHGRAHLRRLPPPHARPDGKRVLRRRGERRRVRRAPLLPRGHGGLRHLGAAVLRPEPLRQAVFPERAPRALRGPRLPRARAARRLHAPHGDPLPGHLHEYARLRHGRGHGRGRLPAGRGGRRPLPRLAHAGLLQAVGEHPRLRAGRRVLRSRRDRRVGRRDGRGLGRVLRAGRLLVRPRPGHERVPAGRRRHFHRHAAGGEGHRLPVLMFGRERPLHAGCLRTDQRLLRAAARRPGAPHHVPRPD
mmetsp:Transcript_24721/g.64191  ORF Transcript_24721/g.64191 Transcript_24721/m.64191 type:complete len:277 (-) Transcript_24721:147-977(-)